MKTATELADTFVEQAVESAFEQLVQHINADKSDNTSDTDELVYFPTLVVNAVNLNTEVAVDATCCVIQNAILFHISFIFVVVKVIIS